METVLQTLLFLISYPFPAHWEDYLNGNPKWIIIAVSHPILFPISWENNLNGNPNASPNPAITLSQAVPTR
ncbi:hypothetical protein [Microcoleus sp. FACHB-672]|uniref:hypothetical protein n=1 Tax=Microcoleus sp. FACHB-672 TaxID=2692825 RepID=UPI001684A46C|nr:hypothetical protein [Microcoleus sp. FACHB-672]MBD2040181.1 hypothetical protein [Microcoleus sp. FACHB-672]